MTTILPSEERLIYAPSIDEFNFRIEVVAGYDGYSGSEVTSTQSDSLIRTVTTDYSDPYYDINIVGVSNGVILYTSGSSGALTGNRVTRVSDGTCTVFARSRWMLRSVSLNMSRINDSENVYHEGFVDGSLAKHITDATSLAVSGNGLSNMPIFSIQNHGESIYERNPTCWAYDYDMTSVSPWNSLGGNTRAGVAITPLHTVHAAHYPVSIGTTIRFVANDNSVVNRTVVAVQNLPETAPYQRDTQIAKLDSALPASITPSKILPANAYEFLPTWKEWFIPLAATNQFERIMCALSKAGDVSPVDYVGAWVTTDEPYASVYERVITGDSGSPAFFIINGELVLICHWIFAGQGAAYHLMIDEINSALNDLGGGYSVQTIDLSEFTNFA